YDSHPYSVLSLHDALPIYIAGAVDHDSKSVWVNVEDAPVRQRFTIAHEIGHIKLHAGDSVIDYRGNLTGFVDGKEAEANRFAARSEEHTSELQSREKLVRR